MRNPALPLAFAGATVLFLGWYSADLWGYILGTGLLVSAFFLRYP